MEHTDDDVLDEDDLIVPTAQGVNHVLARARLRYDVADYEGDEEEANLAFLEMMVIVDAATNAYGYDVEDGRVLGV